MDEVEDNLYYLNDVVSAGIPDVGTLITDSMLKLLIFPLLLPSLQIEVSDVYICSHYMVLIVIQLLPLFLSFKLQ